MYEFICLGAAGLVHESMYTLPLFDWHFVRQMTQSILQLESSSFSPKGSGETQTEAHIQREAKLYNRRVISHCHRFQCNISHLNRKIKLLLEEKIPALP